MLPAVTRQATLTKPRNDRSHPPCSGQRRSEFLANGRVGFDLVLLGEYRSNLTGERFTSLPPLSQRPGGGRPNHWLMILQRSLQGLPAR